MLYKKVISRFVFLLVLITIGIGAGLALNHLFPLAEIHWGEEQITITNKDEFIKQREKLEAKIERHPDDLDRRLQLANMLYNYNKYADDALATARDQYLKIIKNKAEGGIGEENQREIGYLYFMIGNTYREEKNFTEAITAFERGVEIDPNNVDIKYNIAYTYLNDLQDYTTAEKWLIKAGPGLLDDPAFHYNLARIYFGQEKYEDAERELKVAATLESDDHKQNILASDLYRQVLEAQGKEFTAGLEADVDAEMMSTEN